MSRDLSALSHLVIDADLKTNDRRGGSFDASERNRDMPLLRGAGQAADFDLALAKWLGEIPEDDLLPGEEDEDKVSALAAALAVLEGAVRRIWSRTFEGAVSHNGAYAGDWNDHIYYDFQGSSIHYFLFGRANGGGPSQAIIRTAERPFWNQVFGDDDTRFLAPTSLGLASDVFGAWSGVTGAPALDMHSWFGGHSLAYSVFGMPGDVWTGNPGQVYGLNSVGGKATLSAAVFENADFAALLAKRSLIGSVFGSADHFAEFGPTGSLVETLYGPLPDFQSYLADDGLSVPQIDAAIRTPETGILARLDALEGKIDNLISRVSALESA